MDQADDVVLFSYRPAPAGCGGQVAQDMEVLIDLLDHAGTLHLDHNRRAIGQFGAVYLSDGGRGQWHGFEGREYLVDRPPELALDDRGHRFRLQRRGSILKLRQLDLVGRWQQIGAGREDLSELDKGRSQLFQRAADVLRTRQRQLI